MEEREVMMKRKEKFNHSINQTDDDDDVWGVVMKADDLMFYNQVSDEDVSSQTNRSDMWFIDQHKISTRQHHRPLWTLINSRSSERSSFCSNLSEFPLVPSSVLTSDLCEEARTTLKKLQLWANKKKKKRREEFLIFQNQSVINHKHVSHSLSRCTFKSGFTSSWTFVVSERSLMLW